MSLSSIARLKEFKTLDFGEKHEIVTLGRPMPSIPLTQEVRNKSRTILRKFSSDYYKKVDWLCGCNILNRLFCFPCTLFGKSNVWTSSGYFDLVNFWKAVRKHKGSLSHKESSICRARFGKERIELSVSRAHREEIERHNALVDKNRAILRRLVDCVRFLAIHELAFRGNNEDSDSIIQGNFKDLTQLIAEYDPTLQSHFIDNSRFRGQSSKIQNDLIECLATTVKTCICKELSEASFVSIEVDETNDVSVATQCSFVFRYVVDNAVNERFWSFLNISGATSASDIAETVLAVIKEVNVSDKLIAQSYDGAAALSGCKNGAQKLVSDAIPQALYIHCYAHQLNLGVRNALSYFPATKIFFSDVLGLLAYFHRSPKRLKALEDFCGKTLRIPSIYQTRWTFHARTL